MRPSALMRRFRINASRLKPTSRQTFSTPPTTSQPSGPSPSGAKNSHSRLRRFNDRLPRFLRAYTTPLLGAPVTHVTSFLILHEITAIVPLFGLVASFHYGAWMPDLSAGTGENNPFDEGAARFGRWLRKKGWVDESDVNIVAEHEVSSLKRSRAEEHSGIRLVLEFATAYTITKALLPVRIVASAWATPWFARTVLTPANNVAKKLLGKR